MAATDRNASSGPGFETQSHREQRAAPPGTDTSFRSEQKLRASRTNFNGLQYSGWTILISVFSVPPCFKDSSRKNRIQNLSSTTRHKKNSSCLLLPPTVEIPLCCGTIETQRLKHSDTEGRRRLSVSPYFRIVILLFAVDCGRVQRRVFRGNRPRLATQQSAHASVETNDFGTAKGIPGPQ